jgi:uncharacterized protein (UPF0254 family)
MSLSRRRQSKIMSIKLRENIPVDVVVGVVVGVGDGTAVGGDIGQPIEYK